MVQLVEFFTKLESFKEGILSKDDFKKLTSPMGIYEERNGGTYMVRLKIPAGVLSLETLENVYEVAKQQGINKIHFTTRQAIQFHEVPLNLLKQVLIDLDNRSISTKGTGGNTIRNIECGALSGVLKKEAFDVTPHSLYLSEFVHKDDENLKLPRKYKIGFSSYIDDDGNATISDLGFVATINKGVRGFKVYAGGGLGGKPITSLLIENFINENEFLYYVVALRELFNELGDRNNRNKARIRFIRERLGDEEFSSNLKLRVNRLKESQNLYVNMIEKEKFYEERPKNIIPKFLKNILTEQKQKGYYSLLIHPQNGNFKTENFKKIINLLKEKTNLREIRLTNAQSFYIRDLTFSEAISVYEELKELTSPYRVFNSITCSGARICEKGILNSQGVLEDIKEAFKNENAKVKNALAEVHISGCPNSCGQHQKVDIGLMGKTITSKDGLIPSYNIFLGGRTGANATLGKSYGNIPAKKIGKFLVEISRLKVMSKIKDFNKFIETYETEINNLIEDNSGIESFNRSPHLYFDFGSRLKFMDKRNITWQEGVNRSDKERLLSQKGVVILLTGLSGAGKSTIALDLEKKLHSKGKLTYLLDGDNLRHGLNSDLSFSEEDRKENIRRVREVSTLFLKSGIITLLTFIAPFKEDRESFRNVLGEDYIEIFVEASVEECKKRDVKGLYKKANLGEIKEFTAVSSPYEVPENPDIYINTESVSKDEAVNKIIKYLQEKELL